LLQDLHLLRMLQVALHVAHARVPSAAASLRH
jgi:hypothetical protein